VGDGNHGSDDADAADPDAASPGDAADLGAAGPSAGFRQLSAEEMFRGRVFRLERARFVDPDGEEFERQVVRHPGAVAVVPAHPDGTVTLVRQFRPAVGRTMLEIPAGTRDVDGEAPELTARRELAEEAGLVAGRLEQLAALYNSPGYSDQVTIVYLATDLTPCPTERSGTEEHWMTLEKVDLHDLPQLVADGTLRDATTVHGLWMARRALGLGT
jgi:ADP-ribose pyrophosphatase